LEDKDEGGENHGRQAQQAGCKKNYGGLFEAGGEVRAPKGKEKETEIDEFEGFGISFGINVL